MIFKGILTLLTYFFLQNGVRSNSQEALFEITDIKSIKNFILEHYNISRLDHLLFQNLTSDEKNKTARNFELEMTKLFEKLLAMKSTDGSLENNLWNQLLKEFKPHPVGYNDDFDLFYLNARLETVNEAIDFDVSRLSELFFTFSESNDSANNCLHSWASNWFFTNDRTSSDIGSNFHTDIRNFNNIPQVFFYLILHLSQGEIKEKNSYDYCDRVSSFHQGLYNLYRQIVIINFKEFSVKYFTGMGLAVCSNESTTYNSEKLRRFAEDLLNSLKMIMESTKRVLHNTTYYMYSCDPTNSDNTRDDTNLELEKMIQTVIIAEKDLSTTQSCSHNCNLDSIKDTINRTECDDFLDCHYDTGGYLIFKSANSSRRYKYFTSKNGKELIQYGNRDRYFDNRNRYSEVFSSYSWSTMRFCDYCLCSCVMKRSRSSHSVSSISFRNQVSDIDNNKAVVGFKFVKKDRMVHIQILEGQVLPHSIIGNPSWKSLEKFDYSETTEKFYVLIDDDSKVPLELGVDYGHPNIMNLNDVRAPEKHIITGVRFRFAGDSLDFPKRKQGPIELQIRVTPLDFIKGKLINIDQSSWISPKEQALKELMLKNPDNPTYMTSNIDPIITTNKFVKFRASDLKKDAGQSTVPFIDGREIRFYENCPVGGIGLIHRGRTGSGGYLAIKIFDFDMSPYFNITDDFPHSLFD